MVPPIALVVIGHLLQAATPTELIAKAVVVAVGDDGVIQHVEPAESDTAQGLVDQAERVVRLTDDQRLLPGLIDLHIHAPQWPQLGTGLDIPLEDWLFQYTFPLEARYSDPTFAARVWQHMVPTLLAHGTTTAVYYATVDEDATAALAAACLEHGQRAFVGRVAMDHPVGTPEYYRDPDADTGIARSRRSIDTIRSMAGPDELVRPIVTPRFVPACTDELLAGLGALAEETGTLVQTHCSESDWEHGYVLERYGRTDTDVLASFGLARDHSVLAHAGHVTDDDMAHLARLGAAVAHCPISNVYFGHVVFPLRRALAAGVRVGLGTDISGGPHPSLLHVASMTATASRLLEDGVDPAQPADHRGVPDSRVDALTAFWVATAGGADALGIPAGLLEPGRVFDAFVVNLGQSGSALQVWPEIDNEARVFEKIVHLGAEHDISAVWVNGRLVSGRAD